MKRFNKRAQSTLEYALIISVAVAALLTMQHYMRRGVEGKLRSSIDDIGEQYSAGNVTGTIVTGQTGEMKTQETFGLVKDGASKQIGVSYYKVKTPASITRSTDTKDTESIGKTLAKEREEGLFPQ